MACLVEPLRDSAFIAGGCCVCDNLGIESRKIEADVTGESVSKKFWSGNEIREGFLRFFEGQRAPAGAELVAGAAWGRYPAVYECGDEPVQGRFPWTGETGLHAGDDGAEVRARGREAQRPGKCGVYEAASHVFRDAGEFSFGDLLQRRSHRLRLGTSDFYSMVQHSCRQLYFTVFGGADMASNVHIGLDQISLNSWRAVGAPTERIVPLSGEEGLKELFWSMGDTGPCGSCSEIHYDMGPAASDEGHKDCKFPCDCGRYVEIWNLVFMQWNRDANGNLTPLPKQSVDTGIGLERVAAVLQGVVSNYDTDLFKPLIARASELIYVTPGFRPDSDASLRIISDHSRAATFLISDGVIPSNDGRGYVLRKIMRRAIYHGRIWNKAQPFLHEMV